MNWFPFTYRLDNLITNSIHAWLTKDYRSSGMSNDAMINQRHVCNMYLHVNTDFFTVLQVYGEQLANCSLSIEKIAMLCDCMK